MKIGIVGTGAVGGFYGALLSNNGFDVHFLLNTDYDHVRENGLLIESIYGDFTLYPVSAYDHPKDMPECDLVIVALKTTNNYLLNKILPVILKNDGIAVTLQNGLDIEKDISEIIPSATVMGGLCFLCSNKVGPGHIHHLDYGSMRLGQYRRDGLPSGITQAMKQVAGIFSKASIPVQLVGDLGKARWEKLVWNMSFNGTTVILNTTTDRIMKNASSRALVAEIMQEVIVSAKASGFDIQEDFKDKMLSATERMVDYRPSMKIDFDSGRPLEIENIYRRPIQFAESRGIDMPRSKLIACILEFMDSENRKNASIVQINP